MEKILRTDNAYQAIDKINSNFAEAGAGGDNARIEGEITGNGNDFVYYHFSAKPGDYMHVEFPNGSWATTHSRDSYNRLVFGWVDNNNTHHSIAEISRESWVVPEYGYDLYVSDGVTNMKEAYLAFRAEKKNSRAMR